MVELFAYGTLKDFEVQKSVFGRIIPGIEDELSDYQIATKKIEGRYLVIEYCKGGTVFGRVLAVTPEELAQIDHYEGELYSRKEVFLKSGIKAWVYVESR